MNDRKYWRKRSVKLGLLSERKAQRTARAVLDAYDKVLTTVQGRIERIFARFVRNNDSLNAEKARQLLSVRETQKYRQELLVLYHSTTDKALRDELRAMLEAPAYANRISHLDALRDIVRADCRQLGLLERELVGKGLADALQEAYTRQVFDIQQGTGYGRRIKTLEDKQVRAILGQKWRGGNFSGRIWNNNQAFADAVQQTILTGTLAGMSFREMSDMLLQITGIDATSGAKANSMRLIRTEFCHISTQGALLGYKSYDLEYYRYLATLDSQTDEECGALDMRRFPVKDAQPGVNFPPMHPNCRCTTMPDMSEQVIAKIRRAARDPATGKSITVPGNMSYAEWHNKFVQGAPEAERHNRSVKRNSNEKGQYELHDEQRKTGYKGLAAGDSGQTEQDAPRLVKEIDPKDGSLIDEELKKAQRDFAKLEHEEDLTITQDGKVWHTRGSAGSVNPWGIEKLGSSLKNSCSYHNHPPRETHYSLSEDDVRFFFDSGQFLSKAADNIYEYAMMRTEATLDVDGETAYHRFREIYRNDIYDLSWNGLIDIDEDGYHETMKRLSKEYHFVYARRKLNGSE